MNNYKGKLNSKKYFFYKCFFIFLFVFLYFHIKIIKTSKIIEENFFIIDSNNLETIKPHMYGYSLSKKGFLTNNYYKKLGHYEEPEPLGAYIMIRKKGNEIWLNQDFNGSFGIYIYENKKSGYFAISNSFLLLEEYLIGKQNFTFNKDFADNFIISGLCTPSIYETLVNEIVSLPPNIYLVINIKNRSYKICNIDFKENTIPLESEEGLKIIDKWVDKWGYIFRSLKKQIDFSADLSGGFDTRVILSIILNSGINLNSISIRTNTDKKHTHEEDYKIASNISSKFGFQLNKNTNINNDGTKFSIKDSLFCTIYAKLGFHKEFYIKYRFFNKPRFHVAGSGGELLRGYQSELIEEYIHNIASQGKGIKGHEKEFYNSSVRICNRSIALLKKKKTYYSENQITSDIYSMGRNRNHFGKANIEGYLANIYTIQPIIDPDIRQIKFDLNEKNRHDLIAYIYVRFSHDLVNFPVQGKRILNDESIKKAEQLNNKLPSFKIKYDYNKNFFIDFRRKSPVSPSNDIKSVEGYLKQLFNSFEFKKTFNKVYDNTVYNWAKAYSNKSNYHPLRHGYGIYAVVKTLEDLSLNEKILRYNKENKR